MNSTIASLIQQKENAESELEAQISVLTSNGMTLHSALVDREGFPRDDVDLYAVRAARARVHELRNDLKALVDQIGKALETVYDPSVQQELETETETEPSVEGPFAKVNGVAPKSPAAEAGLQREDVVLKFGTLTQSSFSGTSLQPLADLVAANENRSLPIKVIRAGQPVVLRLTPKQGWGGRGTLGCHIVPYMETTL